MKMIMAIVGKDDEMETSAQLVAKGYFVTKIATSGGFLKRKHVTLIRRSIRRSPLSRNMQESGRP